MSRYKKGELKFMKGFTPAELLKYQKTFPEMKKSVNKFRDEYEYKKVKKIFKWTKRK